MTRWIDGLHDITVTHVGFVDRRTGRLVVNEVDPAEPPVMSLIPADFCPGCGHTKWTHAGGACYGYEGWPWFSRPWWFAACDCHWVELGDGNAWGVPLGWYPRIPA